MNEPVELHFHNYQNAKRIKSYLKFMNCSVQLMYIPTLNQKQAIFNPQIVQVPRPIATSNTYLHFGDPQKAAKSDFLR